MIRILKSEGGFSILQGLLLASAVAGMAYVGTKLTTDQKLAAKGTDSKNRVEQLNAMIYSIVQNKKHCTSSFQNYGIFPAANTTQFLRHIWTEGSVDPVFSHHGGDAANVYMNNSVTIEDMNVIFPADLSQHADLKIVYGKLNWQDTNARTGKGFGAQQVTKIIKLKIQRNPVDDSFESCYAVDETQNQHMVKEFCEGLGTGFFTWSDTYQKCLLEDINCPVGQVFAGYDSLGAKKCNQIKDWMNIGDLIDPTATSCKAGTFHSARFVTVGTKVQVKCDCYTDCANAGYSCQYSIPGCPSVTPTTTCSGAILQCTNAAPSGSPACLASYSCTM